MSYETPTPSSFAFARLSPDFTWRHPTTFILFSLCRSQTLLPHRLATPLELHGSCQTSNLIIVLRHHIRDHTVLSRRDLLRQIDLFGQRQIALLEWAREVDLFRRVAEVGGLLDDGDEAVFDLEVKLGAFRDVLVQGAGGGDGEGFAAMGCVC